MNISACKRVHPNPRHPGDIGDIGDIFRKSLKLLDFLNAHTGDISGIFSGTGIFRGIFSGTGIPTRKTPLRVRCTGRFDGIDESSQNCHSEALSMGRTSGNRGKCPARVLRAQDTLRVLCTGRFDGIGEPLSPKVRTQAEFGLAGTPSGSTYEAPTVSVLATVRHFRTVVTRAGKCVSGGRNRTPPPRFPQSSFCA